MDGGQQKNVNGEITGRKYVKTGEKLRKHVVLSNVVSDIDRL